MTSPYYLPSGRVPFATFPLLALGAIAAVPGAWIYAWLAGHMPFAITMVATCALSLYLGMIAKCCANWAKVRNPVWMGRFGTLIGAFGWYFQWAAFFAIAGSEPTSGSTVAFFTYLLASPGDMIRLLMSLSESGAYRLFGISLGPAVLFVTWAMELAILLVLPHVFGQQTAAEPFDEAKNSWMEEIRLPHKFLFIPDPQAAIALLENRPDQLYSVLVPNSEESPRCYASASLYRSTGNGEPFLSITNIEIVGNEKKPEENGTLLFQFLRLAGMDADNVIQHLNAQTARAAGPAQSPSQPNPPELAKAIEHLEAGRFDVAYACAVSFITAEETGLRTDANRVCALATSHLGRWTEAAGYWNAVFADEPTAYNALQIANSSVMLEKTEDGEQWLLQARELNASTGEVPDMSITTSYITALSRSGRHAAALPYLEEIKKVYEEVSITDPTYLSMRQLPSFDAFLNNSAEILSVVLSAEQGHAWYSSMLPHLDERGKSELNDWLNKFALAPG
jgi:tetratricopeptide (TPR) repeat protein